MPDSSIHAGVKLADVLPASIDHISGVSSSTALVSRKRIRLVPNTSATGNPGDTISFLIQDPGMLDLRSAVFHANVVVSGATAGTVSMDDGPSWLNTLNTVVDGQNLESVSRVNKLTNMETYMTCNKALYDRALSFSGFWKYSSDIRPITALASASTQTQFQDVSSNLVAAAAFYGTATTGWDIGLPLGLVSHVFRSEKLFPSRFANNFQIQFLLEQANVAIFGNGALAGTPTYQLTNCYLEIDSITLNPAFTAFLQDKITDPSGDGLVLPFNTKVSSTGQVAYNSGENSFVVSRSSKNLKRIALVVQPSVAIGAAAVTYPECSTFPSAGFANNGSVQLLVAGNYYPQFPQKGSMAYWTAHSAYNGSPITDCDGGIVNYRTYQTTTNGAIPFTANTGSGVFSDSWIWAYDLSKLTGTSEPLENDGVDSTGNAQVQITIKSGAKENGAAAESYTPLVELLGTKYLTISQSQLKIMG